MLSLQWNKSTNDGKVFLTSPMICSINQLTRFYLMVTLVFSRLKWQNKTRDILRTQRNIYDGAFLRKKIESCWLCSPKISIIDVRLGPKKVLVSGAKYCYGVHISKPWVNTSFLGLITDVVILTSKTVCSPRRNYEIAQLYNFLKGVKMLLIIK